VLRASLIIGPDVTVRVVGFYDYFIKGRHGLKVEYII
jgi:hypothetical protein